MAAPLPTPVPTWHNDTYAAIDPNNQTLSQAGKTIIITGAGTGVGRATALAFAQAKARHIILIGRTERTLRETESIILKELQEPPEITIFPASVSSPTQINTLASTISSSGNGWDVLILNAATVGDPPGSSVLTMDMSSFWEVYETNLLSIFLITQALFPLANTGACALNVGAAGSVLPSRLSPGIGTYASSKIAAAKLVEFLAFENPTIFLCTVHPGIIMTPMLEKSGLDKDKLPLDSVELPAHFLLWLAQQKRDDEKERKAEFLRGKFLWANWDVEELVQKTEEIRQSEENTVGLVGFPYGQKLSV